MGRNNRSSGTPTWVWVLIGVGGFVIVGGVVVCAGLVWMGKKTGEALQQSVEKSQKEQQKDEDEVLTLIDNTESMKGRKVQLEATLSSGLFQNKNQSLRDLRGKDAEFYTFSRKSSSRLDITIRIPESGEIPAAVYGDKLRIEFICTEGRKDRGNIASVVSRVSK